MDQTARKRSVAGWFVRTYLGRSIIALRLIAIVQLASTRVVVNSRVREHRIAKKLLSLGAKIEWEVRAPDWVPQSVKDRLPVFGRITSIDLTGADAADVSKFYSEIASLSCLNDLELKGDQVTNGRLESLKATSISNLFLY